MTGLSPPAQGFPDPTALPGVAEARARKRRRRPPEVVVVARRALWLTKTRIGLGLVTFVVGLAVVGPFVASPAPSAVAGAPYGDPSSAFWLGTDALGRSVLSRVLAGGWVILLCALLAAMIGVGLGALLGLLASWRFGLRDEFIMRSLDVILSFPPIILGLLLVSVVGPKLWLVVLAVALWHMPGTARVVRSVALEVRRRDFVQMAEALGLPSWRIMAGEILPNITSQVLVEFGLRLTWSIGLIASLSFLGFGRQPPAADWGYMIYENLLGLSIQPWGVVIPIILIALLTIGVNFITDGIQRSLVGIVREGDAAD
jgi:peptide/nickel transport system permease protein